MNKESRTLEYKREISDLRKIASTVVAFANGSGGEIIVGVDDKSRSVIGLSPEQVDSFLEKLPMSLADQIRPPLFPSVYSRSIENKEVLVVQVYPGPQKPYYIASDGIERGTFIRVGAHTRHAEGETLEELRLQRLHLTYDEAPISNCSIKELDLSGLPVSLRTERGLLALDVIRHDPHSGSYQPTRGGILMLCHNPEKYVGECETIVSKMRGDSGRNTVESHILTGPLPAQAAQALDLLTAWLGADPALSKGRYVNTRSKLPFEALRESVHNALFHRQYSIQGAVKIALYANRLEIFSPGHFAGPFVAECLGDGSSYVRNRVICALARRMGLIEKRGTGIQVIRESMTKQGLQMPVFEEGQQWFKVTLFLGQLADYVESDPELAIMRLFEEKATITSSDVCAALNVSRATAVSFIKELVRTRKVARKGRGPTTRYVIA